MQKPSKERIATIARLLLDEIEQTDSVELLKDRDAVRQALVSALADELRHEEERQQLAAQRLPAELSSGSKEWESALRRLLDDEYIRGGE